MTFNNYNQLSEISTSVGDSFYIFDRSRLIENYQHFTSSFKKYYKNTLVAYAYKANYAPFVVKTIKKMGALSEVVSTMEYDIALKCNVEPSNIILMYPFGIIYIILGEVFISITALFINTYYTKKFIDYGFFEQWRDIKQIILGGIFAGFVSYIVTNSLVNLWLLFIVGGFLTPVLFIIYQYLCNNKIFIEIVSLRANYFNQGINH